MRDAREALVALWSPVEGGNDSETRSFPEFEGAGGLESCSAIIADDFQHQYSMTFKERSLHEYRLCLSHTLRQR